MRAEPNQTAVCDSFPRAGRDDAPREQAPVLVRNRRGVIREVRTFTGRPAGPGHLVRVDYEDDADPASDWLLWEVENQSARRIVRPDVAGTPPLPPAEFHSLVRAAQWNSALPLPGMPGAPENALVLAPALAAISPEGYQLVPLEMALEMPRLRLMIADDVGLGKTVEAGLIVSELLIRRRIRRVLVLCPPGLRRQWQRELAEKFGLGFQVVDGPSSRRLAQTAGGEPTPWKSYDRIIASYYYLRQARVMEQFLRSCDSPAKPQLPWDLLIVDEVHNLTPNPHGEDSELTKMLRRLTQWFEHRLFITATPHNGYPSSFHGLLEILDPASFARTSLPTVEQEARVSGAVVRRLKHEVRPPGSSPGRVISALLPTYGSRELDLFATVNALRRRLLGWGALPGPEGRETPSLAVEVLGKRLLSSVPAFAASFQALLEGLEEGPSPRKGAVSRASRKAGEAAPSERVADRRWLSTARTIGRWMRSCYPKVASDLEEICDALGGLGVDPKGVGLALPSEDARYDCFAGWLRAHLRPDKPGASPETAVVFTEYRSTLDYLLRRLTAEFAMDRVKIITLHGDLRESERIVAVEQFTGSSAEALILLTTDVGSEGLNLHTTCRYLFHYDIPWNPARLEQRLGRLDRHGQRRRVEAFHFAAGDEAAARLISTVSEKAARVERDLGRAAALLSAPPLAGSERPQTALLPALPALASESAIPRGACARKDARSLAAALRATHRLLGLDAAEFQVLLEEGLRVRSPDVSVVTGPDAGGYAISGLTREARFSLSQLVGYGHNEGAAPPFPQVLQWAARLIQSRAGGRWTVHRHPLPLGVDAALVLFVRMNVDNSLGHTLHSWLSPSLALFAGRGGWRLLEGRVHPPGLLESLVDAVTAVPPLRPAGAEAVRLARSMWAANEVWVERFMSESRDLAASLLEEVLSERKKAQEARLKVAFAQRRSELAEAAGRRGDLRLVNRRQGLLEQRDSLGLLLPSVARSVHTEIAALEREIGRRHASLRRLEMHLEREETRLLKQVLPAEHEAETPIAVALEAVAVIVNDGGRRQIDECSEQEAGGRVGEKRG